MKSIFAVLLAVLALASADWCYKKEHCGQHTWGGRCQNKGHGATQTPINLKYERLTYSAPKMLHMTSPYFVDHNFEATNSGHSCCIKVIDAATPLTMSGEPLMGKNYTFSEIHFHWGSNATCGSEHTLNNRRHAMEIHFVHYRSDFKSTADALASNERDAIAVFAILAKEEGDKSNVALQPIVDVLSKIRYKGESVVGEKLNIVNLVPEEYKSLKKQEDTYILRYYGSLTTPGCQEAVLWNVCTIVVPISTAQIQEFRSMYTHGPEVTEKEKENLVDNFRELQDMNERELQVYRGTFRRNRELKI